MSPGQRAGELREALLVETLDEVARLHDAVQAIGPTLQAAVTESVAQGKKEVSEHTRDQATYVEQTMLRDREKFVTEQKAALEALDARLRDRDAALVKLMTDILEQGRERFAAEVAVANEKPKGRPAHESRGHRMFAMLALGMALGAAGAIGGAWLVIGQ